MNKKKFVIIVISLVLVIFIMKIYKDKQATGKNSPTGIALEEKWKSHKQEQEEKEKQKILDEQQAKEEKILMEQQERREKEVAKRKKERLEKDKLYNEQRANQQKEIKSIVTDEKPIPFKKNNLKVDVAKVKQDFTKYLDERGTITFVNYKDNVLEINLRIVGVTDISDSTRIVEITKELSTIAYLDVKGWNKLVFNFEPFQNDKPFPLQPIAEVALFYNDIQGTQHFPYYEIEYIKRALKPYSVVVEKPKPMSKPKSTEVKTSNDNETTNDE